MGYLSILVNHKTCLNKAVKNGKYLASEYDNMFYITSKINSMNKGVISYYNNL